MHEDVRQVEALSIDQERVLDQTMAQISTWVSDANTAKKLALIIQSVSVKKALDKWIKDQF